MQDLIEAVRRVREIMQKYPDVIECTIGMETDIHLFSGAFFEPLNDGAIVPHTEFFDKQHIDVDGIEIFRLIPKGERNVS